MTPPLIPRGLGTIRQTAYVVEDIEKSAAAWAAVHGVGPFYLYDVDTPSVYRGRETAMRGRMGLAQSGIQQVELIQPDLSTPSLYTELLDASGPGFHHVCYWVDIDDARDHFLAHGSELVQHGVTPDGNRFVYVSGAVSGTCAVPYVEFLDPNEGMMKLFDLVERAAIDWDHRDPVRFL